MKKKNIYNVKTKWFLLSLILSIIAPISIPLIPIGFVIGKPLWIVIAGVSSGIVFFAFYGIPLFWVHHGTVKKRVRIHDAIEKEYLYNINDISTQTNISDINDIRNIIYYLIEKGYLVGYLFDGENVSLNENSKLGKTKKISICPYCGSKKIILTEENEYICSYCDAHFNLS